MAGSIEIILPEFTAYQREFLYCPQRFTAVEAATKSGKTFSHQLDAFEFAHKPVNPGDEVWWLGPSYSQVRMVFDELVRMVKPIPAYRLNTSDLTITMPTGGILRFKTGERPDLLFGPSNVRRVYVDEFTRCRLDLWPVVRSLVTATGGKVKMIGNYTGEDTAWHQWIKTMQADPDFRYFKVTAEDAVKAGVMPRAEFDSARRTLSPSVFAALYLCEGVHDDTMLVQYSAIADLWTNEHVPHGTKYITADVARYGHDRTVIGLWSGLRLLHMVTMDKSGMDHVVATIRQLATQEEVPMSRCMVDDDGVGGGVVDFLRCVPFNGGLPADKVDGAKEMFPDLRTQNYYKLADAINDRGLCIETQEHREHIERELVLIRKEVKEHLRGLLRIKSKDDIKARLGRSPDYSDMMMMRMRFEHLHTNDAVDSIRDTLKRREEVRARAAVTQVRRGAPRPGTFGGR